MGKLFGSFDLGVWRKWAVQFKGEPWAIRNMG